MRRATQLYLWDMMQKTVGDMLFVEVVIKIYFEHECSRSKEKGSIVTYSSNGTVSALPFL
jgi:hypothetical protein